MNIELSEEIISQLNDSLRENVMLTRELDVLKQELVKLKQENARLKDLPLTSPQNPNLARPGLLGCE